MEAVLKNPCPVRLVSVTRDGLMPESVSYDNSAQLSVLLRSVLPKDREGLAVVHLDCQFRVISVEIAAIGTLDSVPATPREVFKGAILAGAHSIVLAHNHPGGTTDPSEQDIKLTKRMMECGQLLGIPVMDMVIVNDTGYRSLDMAGDLRDKKEQANKKEFDDAMARGDAEAALKAIMAQVEVDRPNTPKDALDKTTAMVRGEILKRMARVGIKPIAA